MVQLTVEMAIIIANDYIANNEKLTELRDFEDLKQEIYLDVIKRTGSYAILETAKEMNVDREYIKDKLYPMAIRQLRHPARVRFWIKYVPRQTHRD